MVVMKNGITYEQRKEHRGYKLMYKRFKKCPKCHEQVYNGSIINFQDILVRATEKIK